MKRSLRSLVVWQFLSAIGLTLLFAAPSHADNHPYTGPGQGVTQIVVHINPGVPGAMVRAQREQNMGTDFPDFFTLNKVNDTTFTTDPQNIQVPITCDSSASSFQSSFKITVSVLTGGGNPVTGQLETNIGNQEVKGTCGGTKKEITISVTPPAQAATHGGIDGTFTYDDLAGKNHTFTQQATITINGPGLSKDTKIVANDQGFFSIGNLQACIADGGKPPIPCYHIEAVQPAPGINTLYTTDVLVAEGQVTHLGTINTTKQAAGGGTTNTTETAVCSTGDGLGGAVGTLLCPLTQLVVDATDFIQTNFIIPYLTVSPLTTNNDPKTGQPPIAYTLWKSFRDLANVALVIAFFVVIFSQATSIGVSNYGIKKILPRLAIVAIGANLSYFIVGFIIDAFNIFGAGVANLVMGVVNAGAAGNTQNPTFNQEALFSLAAAGLTAIAIKAGVFLKALSPILLGILMIIIVSVVVLIIRQMLILMLVILAPLAIVAYMLPNTEQYYKKWQKLLLELLMMYPLIVLLFASGKIMGAILAGSLNLG